MPVYGALAITADDHVVWTAAVEEVMVRTRPGRHPVRSKGRMRGRLTPASGPQRPGGCTT